MYRSHGALRGHLCDSTAFLFATWLDLIDIQDSRNFSPIQYTRPTPDATHLSTVELSRVGGVHWIRITTADGCVFTAFRSPKWRNSTSLSANLFRLVETVANYSREFRTRRLPPTRFNCRRDLALGNRKLGDGPVDRGGRNKAESSLEFEAP